jgi:hypothetical protein
VSEKLLPNDGGRTIPRDVCEQVLSMGRVEWGATDRLTDAGHIEHLTNSLRLTREHFNFEDTPVAMHGLYLEGTEKVLCHTGTSPNSAPNAQALAGAWNWLHEQCAAQVIEAGTAETAKTGSVEDESAVGSADAPETPSESPQQ